MLSSVYHLLFTDNDKVDKGALIMQISMFIAIMIAIW